MTVKERGHLAASYPLSLEPGANFPETGAGFAPSEQIQLPGASLLVMDILIHPHAKERMEERGATEAEVRATVNEGEKFPAQFGRAGFKRNFTYESCRDGKFFRIKQVVVMEFRSTRIS